MNKGGIVGMLRCSQDGSNVPSPEFPNGRSSSRRRQVGTQTLWWVRILRLLLLLKISQKVVSLPLKRFLALQVAKGNLFTPSSQSTNCRNQERPLHNQEQHQKTNRPTHDPYIESIRTTLDEQTGKVGCNIITGVRKFPKA